MGIPIVARSSDPDLSFLLSSLLWLVVGLFILLLIAGSVTLILGRCNALQIFADKGLLTLRSRRGHTYIVVRLHTMADGTPSITVFGRVIPIKLLSLVILVVQNSSLALIMRYSRTLDGPRYIPSTAVVCAELLKMFASLFMMVISKPEEVVTSLISTRMDWLKMAVPALLYTVQNNLIYVSISNLDTATFQVTYQLKILTTAIFSVGMLSRVLSRRKWTSLVSLAVGIALVQVSVSGAGGKEAHTAATTGSALTGLVAVVMACLSSGFAGVYFEKMLKESKQSVWVRNVQLALYGSVIGLLGVLLTDSEQVYALGFFYGYTPLVWGVIANSALGGLVVAVVVKYADNIAKGFATSVSIVMSSLVSAFLFNFAPPPLWLVGACLVLAATVLYSRPDTPVANLPK